MHALCIHIGEKNRIKQANQSQVKKLNVCVGGEVV